MKEQVSVKPYLIEKLKQIWISKDVIVAKIGSVIDLHNTSFMVIGNVNAAEMDAIMKDAGEKMAKKIRKQYLK